MMARARIGEGTPAAVPGSIYATCARPLGSGFTLTKRFLVDLGGEQVTERIRLSNAPCFAAGFSGALDS